MERKLVRWEKPLITAALKVGPLDLDEVMGQLDTVEEVVVAVVPQMVGIIAIVAVAVRVVDGAEPEVLLTAEERLALASTLETIRAEPELVKILSEPRVRPDIQRIEQLEKFFQPRALDQLASALKQ